MTKIESYKNNQTHTYIRPTSAHADILELTRKQWSDNAQKLILTLQHADHIAMFISGKERFLQ